MEPSILGPESEVKPVLIRCLYCHQPFAPSLFHPQQSICHSPECQRRRKSDYHRRKQQTDPQYRQVCEESRKKWCLNHPNYQRQYRKDHSEYVEQNLIAQKRRDQRRRARNLVKNNLAIDLKRLPAEVWLVGPDLGDLVKNNLAISQVMIFQTVAATARQFG